MFIVKINIILLFINVSISIYTCIILCFAINFADCSHSCRNDGASSSADWTTSFQTCVLFFFPRCANEPCCCSFLNDGC